MVDMYISPTYKEEDLPGPWDMERRIKVFMDRVDGWQLGIADECINGGVGEHGTPPIKDSGFAVMHILMSYFEMIAKFEDGFETEGKSGYYFERGFRRVFPHLPHTAPGTRKESLAGVLYSYARCALYHCGITGPDIVLTGDTPQPILVVEERQWICINPHLLVKHLRDDLKHYVERLRDPANDDLRANFERRWQWVHAQRIDWNATASGVSGTE
jgi:hypothetical protein